MPKTITYRDLQKWLKTLSDIQLGAPVVVTGGADDYGLTNYLAVSELVDVANEHPQISGGYPGPALLVWNEPTKIDLEPGERG